MVCAKVKDRDSAFQYKKFICYDCKSKQAFEVAPKSPPLATTSNGSQAIKADGIGFVEAKGVGGDLTQLIITNTMHAVDTTPLVFGSPRVRGTPSSVASPTSIITPRTGVIPVASPLQICTCVCGCPSEIH